MKPLIYVVEDDLNIQNVIKIALENSQYEIVCFDNGKDLFERLKQKEPHLFILDVMLPGMDGLAIVKRIKDIAKYKDLPIMIVSAKTTELDKVLGLDIGADDYLIKPFGILELVSRVKALLRRTMPESTKQMLELGKYALDLNEHRFVCGELSEPLTNKQFELLKYLFKHEGQTISREELLNKIWGYDFMGESRTLDVHIKEVRKKIYQCSKNKSLIKTIRGVGYKLNL